LNGERAAESVAGNGKRTGEDARLTKNYPFEVLIAGTPEKLRRLTRVASRCCLRGIRDFTFTSFLWKLWSIELGKDPVRSAFL
jgi:hypothetical protein